MANSVKVAALIAAALLAAVALYLYFSPYQQCVRAREEMLVVAWEWQPEAAARAARVQCAGASI